MKENLNDLSHVIGIEVILGIDEIRGKESLEFNLMKILINIDFVTR